MLFGASKFASIPFASLPTTPTYIINLQGLPPNGNLGSFTIVGTSPSPGSFLFDMSAMDIIIQAHAMMGISPTTIYSQDAFVCLNQLNLILGDWINKTNIQCYIDLITLPLTQGQTIVIAPPGTKDIYGAVLNRQYQTSIPAPPLSGINSVDLPIRQISLAEYLNYPNKNIQGLPQVMFIQRFPTYVQMTLWQSSNFTTDHLKYYRVKQVADLNQLGQTTGLQARWLYALIAELAVFVGTMRGMAPPFLDVASQRSELAFTCAASEDQDIASSDMGVDYIFH